MSVWRHSERGQQDAVYWGRHEDTGETNSMLDLMLLYMLNYCQMSYETKMLLDNLGGYISELRGQIEVGNLLF